MKIKPPFCSGPSAAPRGRTLAIDVGGTTLKASVLNARGKMLADRVSIDTPYPCPPKVLVKALVKLVKPLPDYDRISVGFPGYVRGNKVITAPHYGDAIWHGFDLTVALREKLGRPVRLLNDADMQGLAAIKGHGLELVVTLGTGVGTALFRNGELMHALFQFDTVYLGGGNSRNITFKLDANARLISNEDGILGGFMLWAPIRPAPSKASASVLFPTGSAARTRGKLRARSRPTLPDNQQLHS